jgi:alanine racemase
MTRPARVVIDLGALQHNLSRIRSLAPASKVMAIVKADAYGHGLVRVGMALRDADAFGVACLDEAAQLRASGITAPVLLLEGPYDTVELEHIAALDLDIVVHHDCQLQMLEQSSLRAPLRVWLKIDSGMHRLGFLPRDVNSAWQRLTACRNVAREPRLMTHFAVANERDNPLTAEQLRVFRVAARDIKAQCSLANSAAIIASPDTHSDWVRPGLMLYGVSPMQHESASDLGLRPVMSLKSELISVKSLGKGDPVGYGATWRCPEAMRIGIVAAGYGDGYPRHAGTGTPVVVKGRAACIVGNISMDMLAVDLRSVSAARVGDQVELWGPDLPVEVIARHAGTIPYELLCGVQKRLEFIEQHG